MNNMHIFYLITCNDVGDISFVWPISWGNRLNRCHFQQPHGDGVPSWTKQTSHVVRCCMFLWSMETPKSRDNWQRAHFLVERSFCWVCCIEKKSATGIFSASQKSSSPKRPLRNKKNNRSMAPVASRSDDRQGDPGWCSDFRRLVSFKSSKVSETDGDSPDQQISPDPMDRWRRSVSSQQGPSLNLRVWINTY